MNPLLAEHERHWVSSSVPNVIGVVASKLDALNALVRSGDLPQNVNFAISLPVLKAFLARSVVRVTESASRFELRPDEIGDRAKQFTYMIECEPGAQTTARPATGQWEIISRRPVGVPSATPSKNRQNRPAAPASVSPRAPASRWPVAPAAAVSAWKP
jgi:hypothetical protein